MKPLSIDELEARYGKTFKDYQVRAMHAAVIAPTPFRLCLYYKTGSGKTVTGLSCMGVWGQDEVLVLAPPSTSKAWQDLGRQLGIEVQVMSHAKFRAKDTRVSRHTAIIVDEFHLLGGHSGKGWKKMDGLARGLQAPLILMSATPNYNDADRVYCIQHILDPHSCKGGYLEFLYAHCNTKQNQFGRTPLVDNDRPFQRFVGAAEYLASLPGVQYLPDDLVYTIQDVTVPVSIPYAFHMYGLNERAGRIVASQMEERHTRVSLGLLNDFGALWDHVENVLEDLIQDSDTPVLVFSAHATVAEATDASLAKRGAKVTVVTGKTSAKKKEARIQAFRDGVLEVLVGTATLATGTDGMDKACDTLVILDDTDDDAQRRQLIGRIMPRGDDTDVSKKQVHRLVLQELPSP